MSRPMADTPKRRPRRRFEDDFKAQAVRLVLDEGKSVGSVARDLDLTETALREWANRARADRTSGKTGLTTAEREELVRLRKEVRILREEREILRKAAAFFATERRGRPGHAPDNPIRTAKCENAQDLTIRHTQVVVAEMGSARAEHHRRIVWRDIGPLTRKSGELSRIVVEVDAVLAPRLPAID